MCRRDSTDSRTACNPHSISHRNGRINTECKLFQNYVHCWSLNTCQERLQITNRFLPIILNNWVLRVPITNETITFSTMAIPWSHAMPSLLYRIICKPCDIHSVYYSALDCKAGVCVQGNIGQALLQFLEWWHKLLLLAKRCSCTPNFGYRHNPLCCPQAILNIHTGYLPSPLVLFLSLSSPSPFSALS